MGIQDRDYMKRRPDDASPHDPSVESKLDHLATSLLGKHRRWVIGAAIFIGALILVGLIAGLL